MLRARGSKAERGAGSPWAERPLLQPGLAPRRSPLTRPTRGPAAPPLRPAPSRDLVSARSALRCAAAARAHRCRRRRRRRRRCHPHHVTRVPASPAEGPASSRGARARTQERAPRPSSWQPGRRAGCRAMGSGCLAEKGACISVPVPLPLILFPVPYLLAWDGSGGESDCWQMWATVRARESRGG
jgi:hypothetical protein